MLDPCAPLYVATTVAWPARLPVTRPVFASRLMMFASAADPRLHCGDTLS